MFVEAQEMLKRILVGLLTLTLVLPGTAALAWNGTGHRVVALIAYRQLDDATKKRVAAVLRNHPAADDPIWTHRPTNSVDDEMVNLFLNAATFPDDARPPSSPFHKFSRTEDHFINFAFRPPSKEIGDAPDGENLLNTYKTNVTKVKNTGNDDATRAVALSWIFHQVGDVHQPLHTVNRFSDAFPHGDRGGNSVKPFPNPRGEHNLHAFWDDILGGDHQVDGFDQLDTIADSIVANFPRASFGALAAVTDVDSWARESAQIAVSTSYENLDPSLTSFADLPLGYQADARNAARRRVALAGYRLADVLKTVASAPGGR
jgi:hypothetical protein